MTFTGMCSTHGQDVAGIWSGCTNDDCTIVQPLSNKINCENVNSEVPPPFEVSNVSDSENTKALMIIQR